MRVQQDLIDCLGLGLEDDSTLLRPESQQWKHASRPYNVRLANVTKPLAIAYPTSPDQIGHCLKCAQRARVPVVARSGGHSYAAYSLGGEITSSKSERSLVIDMHAFDRLTYDPDADIATVGSGILLGTMNEFLERNGRMIPTGSCPTVGVGGQVLAGGFGSSSRSAGLFLDNLVEMDVVLADGTAHTISDENLSDLYWGMRGAGSSLAIAHTFRLRTHPAPEKVIYFELTLWPRSLDSSPESITRATRLYEAFEEFGESEMAEKELGMFAWHVTPEPGPSEAGWGTKVEIIGQYMGDQANFNRVMNGFEGVLHAKGEREYRLGTRSLSFLESMHQVGGNWTRLEDRGRLNINEHVQFYAKSLLTKRPIPSSNMHQHLSHLLSLSPTINRDVGIEWFVLSPFLGGTQSAVTRLSSTSTAFAHRDIMVVWELYAKTMDENAQSPVDLVEFVSNMAKDLGQVDAVYPAYVDSQLPRGQYETLIWGGNYPRLQRVKARYDPSNLFRYPQSVRPARSTFPLIAFCLCALLVVLYYLKAKRRKRRIRVD